MSTLRIDKLAATQLVREPYEYVVVPGFLPAAALSTVVANYPPLKAGSYPHDEVELTPALRALIAEMDGPEFELFVKFMREHGNVWSKVSCPERLSVTGPKATPNPR